MAAVVTLMQTFELTDGCGSSDWFANPLDGTYDLYQWRVFARPDPDDASRSSFYFVCRHCFPVSDDNNPAETPWRPFACGFRFTMFSEGHLKLRHNGSHWSLLEMEFDAEYAALSTTRAIDVSEHGNSVVTVALSVISGPDTLQELHACDFTTVGMMTCGPVPDVCLRLWESRDLADVSLEVDDGSEVAVHKCILVAHSPVFRDMFALGCKDKQSGRVNLMHLSRAVVMAMVKYLYFGYLETDDFDTLYKLAVEADFYDIIPLKITCEEALVRKLLLEKTLSLTTLPLAVKCNLPELKRKSEVSLITSNIVNTSNAVEWLHIAVKYSAKLLMNITVGFLMVRRGDLSSSKSWELFETQYPEIAKKVLIEHVEPFSFVSGKHVKEYIHCVSHSQTFFLKV